MCPLRGFLRRAPWHHRSTAACWSPRSSAATAPRAVRYAPAASAPPHPAPRAARSATALRPACALGAVVDGNPGRSCREIIRSFDHFRQGGGERLRPPGPKALWQGLQCVMNYVEALQAVGHLQDLERMGFTVPYSVQWLVYPVYPRFLPAPVRLSAQRACHPFQPKLAAHPLSVVHRWR